MNELISKIESILFVTPKPLSLKKLAAVLDADPEDISHAVATLGELYNPEHRGVVLVCYDGQLQLTTNPKNAELMSGYLKEDLTGELSRPALETLAVISYRGPATKAEIEHIRGVNCSLSLRNLLIRGLIELQELKKTEEKRYVLSFDFLNHLGIQKIEDLPEYESLHGSELIEKLLHGSDVSPKIETHDNAKLTL